MCVCLSVCRSGYHLISITVRSFYILINQQKAAAEKARKNKPIVLKLFYYKDIHVTV